MTRTFALLALTLLLTTPASADKEKTYLPDKVLKSKQKHQGWDGSLVLAASSNLAQNNNVVGTTDGISWSLGLQLTGGLGYVRGSHEWTNSFKLAESYAYTTALDEFVKTADELNWKSTYLYFFTERVPWLAGFVDVKFRTSLLPSYDVQAEEYEYQVKQLDGTTAPGVTRRKFRLSDAFAPIYIEDSLGLFGRPLDRPMIRLEAKVGFGSKHIFAADQFAVDANDKDKKIITIKQLDDVHQGGPALSVLVKGDFVPKKIGYTGLAEVMFPVINNRMSSDERNALELTNVLMEFGLSFKLVSWATLDYQFKALREPQLVDKWQLQNNLLLNVNYTLIAASAKAEKKD